jgi:hypothetical protein
LSAEPRLDGEIKRTLSLLAVARAAIYPVYAGGVATNALYQASGNISHSATEASQLLGPPAPLASGAPGADTGGFSTASSNENSNRNIDQGNMMALAEQSGGKAFISTNGLSQVTREVSSVSARFYTLSYAPVDSTMDGNYRHIEVKVRGGDFRLSYRRGYFALDDALSEATKGARTDELQISDTESLNPIDPLRPFMDLGMPQNEQIRFTAKIQPTEPPDKASDDGGAGSKKGLIRYAVDFSVNLVDLDFRLDSDGLHNGTLNLSLIVYDRYGNIIARNDHVVALNIKPDVWTIFENTGVQLHDSFQVPNGIYWLRTGVYDQATHRVGTIEVPLKSVNPKLTATMSQF